MIRKIYVNDLSEIDTENFGVHFTENKNYRHTGGGSNGTTKAARYEVTLFVQSAKVNQAATEVSRENHPHEMEVVLKFNQVVNAEMTIVDKETGYFEMLNKQVQINTGTRCDQWVKNI